MKTVAGDIKVHIDANLLYTKSYLNTACINLIHKLRRFVIDESDGTITCIGLYSAPPHIRLNLFTYKPKPKDLFSRLDSHLHNSSLSLDIAKKMASQATQANENIGFLLKPYLMTVNVVLIQDVFHTIPVSCLPGKETQKEDTTCAICLEDLWTTKHMKFPHCSHRLDMRCIRKWLLRHNSCPLCREMVFEESDFESIQKNKECDFVL